MGREKARERDQEQGKKKESGERGRWVDRLVWDPRVDDYQTVHRRVMDRYTQICAERGDPRVSSSTYSTFTFVCSSFSIQS